jgi:hypothetical protein
MTTNYNNLALLNSAFQSWYWDGAIAKGANRGTLGGTLQLGDGATAATFPTQRMPHGMSFNGANQYLLRDESAANLTFTDPAPFSVELLVSRPSLQIGSYAMFVCKAGGGVGFVAPYVLYLRNDGGTMRIAWGSLSSAGALRGIVEIALGVYWPPGPVTHVVALYDGTAWRIYLNAVQAFSGVAAGCYAPDTANLPLYVGTGRLGAGALASYADMQLYNFGLYPFALQPGEIGQLRAKRFELLQKGF